MLIKYEKEKRTVIYKHLSESEKGVSVKVPNKKRCICDLWVEIKKTDTI